MSRETLNLDSQLHSYLLSVSIRETDIQKELREFTASHPWARMQIAPEQAQFMAFLVKLIGANRVLEIGTFTGYSALAMAQALPKNGKLTTLDIDPDTGDIARQYWEKAGVGQKIRQIIGPAKDSLETLRGPFDLVFLDADKTNYDVYYEKALELTQPGGLILLDNVLWGGRVAQPEAQDPDTLALKSINQKIHQDSRVDLSMLPLADGLTLVRRR